MSVPHSIPAQTPERDIALFRATLSGDLLTPQDPAYAQARRVWNGMVDRYPALIARCLSPQDVSGAVRFGRDHGLPIAVRGGGHNVAGLGTCDNGIVLDLSGMRDFALDAAAGTARVGPGHTWGSFDAAAAEAGLATTGGLISSTGVAGFTLGGGIGWLMRRYGLACDNLVAAELITADGERVYTDESQRPELLWGLRGGGGNFGVVTSFTFRLHPVTTVFGGMALYPAERAREVLNAFAELTATAPDGLTSLAAFITAPPAPFVPEGLQGRPAIAIVACYAGDPADGEATIASLRRIDPPAADLFGPIPYVALQSMLDAGAAAGLRNYWKSGYLRTLEPDFLDHLVERAVSAPSPLTQVHLHHMGGAVACVPGDQTAFAHRDASFALNLVGTWDAPGADDANISWVRETWEDLGTWTSGVYVNFLGAEGDDRVRAAYGDATYARLARLKRQYDPENVFHLNQNVHPAPGGSSAKQAIRIVEPFRQ